MAKGTGDRTFLHDILIEIMKDTSPENTMQKTQIYKKLEQKDIYLSRTTVDRKFLDLEKKGYKLVKTKKGFYLEKTDDSLTDGELRLLIDTIMYSRIIPADFSRDIIVKLAKLGSGTFEKAMNKRAYTAKDLDKEAYWGTIENVELIQKAIFEHKQISCNYITVIDYHMKYKYEDNIILNPYELAFSGGKYYLLCSYENDEELTVLRLDRLDYTEILKSKCVENNALEKVKKEKGIQQYLYNQPELKGGQPIDIDLLCYNDALYEVYDDFGKQNTRIKTVRPENFDDPDTTLISVRTTREAMKSWVIFHADSIVVIKPQDLRDEICDSLKIAQHTYLKSGKPSNMRSRMAISLDEAIREMRIAGSRTLHYTSSKKNGQFERIDISKYDLKNIGALWLGNCSIYKSDSETVYPKIKLLSLSECEYDNNVFIAFPNIRRIFLQGRGTPNSTLEFLKQYERLDTLCISCQEIKDLSPILELKELKEFETGSHYCNKEFVEKLRHKFPECKVHLYGFALKNNS